MSDYAGDYPANHTCVQLPFNTYGDSSASPYDLPGFTSADVKIYKNGTETPRSSANGVTAHTTFNDIVGNNMVLIDLSDNTDAGFYAAGNEYSVAVVDDNEVNGRKWIGTFSIERAGGALAVLKSATHGLSALKTLIDTVDTVADAIKVKTDKLPGVALITGAIVDDAANSATTFKTNLSQTETDHFKDAFVTFTSGTLTGQTHRVSAYNGGTKFLTTAAFSAEPAAADTFEIINK